jgi:hypothetical protein
VRLKLCPLFSYEFKNALDEDSTGQEWIDLFDKVYVRQGEFLDQEHLRKRGGVPQFEIKDEEPEYLVIKSNRFHHLLPGLMEKHPSIRGIAIVRHPCASIHSWLTNPLEFPAGEDPLVQWRTGECRKTGPGEFWGFDDWKKVTGLHMALAEKYPDRFLVVRYEDLVDSAVEMTKKLFDWCGIPYTGQTERFLKNSQQKHSDDIRSVYKSPAVKSRWKAEMNKELRDAILGELVGTRYERFIRG